MLEKESLLKEYRDARQTSARLRQEWMQNREVEMALRTILNAKGWLPMPTAVPTVPAAAISAVLDASLTSKETIMDRVRNAIPGPNISFRLDDVFQQISTQDPAVRRAAVNVCLFRLVNAGILTLVSRGSGRIPAVFTRKT